MNKLMYVIKKMVLSVWLGVILLILTTADFLVSYKIGASDWSIFWNIFDVVFSVRILYDHFRWKRQSTYHSKEFDEIMKVVKPEIDVMFAEMMKECTEEKYKQFLVEANKVIDREARRRSRSRVSRSDKP